jgi:SAM-dependent methyltransferase
MPVVRRFDVPDAAHGPETSSAAASMAYLETQAEMGISKHIGGWDATLDLWSLCHLAEAKEVLEVGCGIGVGPANIARKFACRVVATDISDRMLLWAKQRAHSLGVEDRIEFRQADVLRLPFEGGRFDAVIVESVLAFVDDKPAAVAELVRVTRPGGYIGVNEGVWTSTPPQDVEAYFRTIAGPMATAEQWRLWWEQSGLHDRVFDIRKVNLRREVRDRTAWLGAHWMLSSAMRMMRLFASRPEMRRFMKDSATKVPFSTAQYMGYALLAGRR